MPASPTLRADSDAPRAGTLGISYPRPARIHSWPDAENCTACGMKHGTVLMCMKQWPQDVEELACVDCAGEIVAMGLGEVVK